MIEIIAHNIHRNLLALMSRYSGVILLTQTVGLPNIDLLIKQHKLDSYRKDYKAINFFMLNLTAALFYKLIRSLRNIPKAISKNPNFTQQIGFKNKLPCHDAIGEELRKFIGFLVDFNANLIIKAKEIGAITKKHRVLFDDVKITLIASRYEGTYVLYNTKNKQYEPMIVWNLSTINSFIGIGIVETGNIGGTKVYTSLKEAMDKLIGEYEQAYDMGYTDFNRYIDHMENGEKFVTPLKDNIKFTPLAEKRFRGRKDGILADINVAIDAIDKYIFRLVKKKKRTKKGSFHLLTNDFEKTPPQVVEWYNERGDIEVVAKNTTVELYIKEPYGYLFETVVASILFKIIAYNMLLLFKFITNRQDWSVRELIDYVEQPFDYEMELVNDIWKRIIELYDQMDKHRSLSAPKLITLTNWVETQFINKF